DGEMLLLLPEPDGAPFQASAGKDVVYPGSGRSFDHGGSPGPIRFLAFFRQRPLPALPEDSFVQEGAARRLRRAGVDWLAAQLRQDLLAVEEFGTCLADEVREHPPPKVRTRGGAKPSTLEDPFQAVDLEKNSTQRRK